MLVHHGSESYEVAASEAANKTRVKLQGLIDGGPARVMPVLTRLSEEVISDSLVPRDRLTFAMEGDHFGIRWLKDDFRTVHKNAVTQLATTLGIPPRWANDNAMGKDWQPAMMTKVFNDYVANNGSKKVLLRAVNDEVRAVLSPSFKRMDSGPIIQAFLEECNVIGARPYEAQHTDVHVAIKALLPYLFEPVANEVMAFGVVLQNSDFGKGALSLRVFALRLVCTNLALMEESLRQVHLGKRLEDVSILSEQTIQLDTAALISMVRDVIRGALSSDSINANLTRIQAANKDTVTPTAVNRILEKNFQKETSRLITETFNSADVEMLPPGQTRLRLSNAISWVAGNNITDLEERLGMQTLAGELITGVSRSRVRK